MLTHAGQGNAESPLHTAKSKSTIVIYRVLCLFHAPAAPAFLDDVWN